MDRIRQLILPGLFAVVCLLSACGAETGGPKDPLPDSTDVSTPQVSTSLPSPIQLVLLLLNADAPYNNELLNPHTKAEAYPSAYKQALNLGVYQADLGYIIAHQQTQEALNYFQSVKKLGDKLGIIGAFEDGMMDRAEKNLGSKDSLLDISSDAFADAGTYLDANQRPEVAGLIVVGGWVESTYLATQTLKVKDNALLRRRIGQDKLLLPRLIALVDAQKGNPDYAGLATKLRDLESAYANVVVQTDYKAAETDSLQKVTRIGSKTKVRYKKEDLKLITDKVAALRNEFVQ